MIETISDLPKGVTGLRATGRVNRTECRSVLRPIIEDAARTQGRVSLAGGPCSGPARRLDVFRED